MSECHIHDCVALLFFFSLTELMSRPQKFLQRDFAYILGETNSTHSSIFPLRLSVEFLLKKSVYIFSFIIREHKHLKVTMSGSSSAKYSNSCRCCLIDFTKRCKKISISSTIAEQFYQLTQIHVRNVYKK
jgi:hypothetical protein